MTSIYDEQIYNLILNRNNLDTSDASNTKYTFNFNGTKRFSKAKIALSNIQLFYSWFNISQAFNNNEYQFTFTDGAGTTTYTVTMPDGYYSINDLNTFLQTFLINNGLYLVNDAGENVYYLQIQPNQTFYAIQLDVFPFPTALPVNWSNPAGLTFPVTASTPQWIIPTTNFSTFVGIPPGTYPAAIQATAFSVISSFTPQVNPTSSLILSCNLLNNRISNPNNLLYSFSAGDVGFGGLINSSPNELIYIDIQEGYYSSVELQILNQNFQSFNINDANIIVQLTIREKME